jgi:hypothetical protein
MAVPAASVELAMQEKMPVAGRGMALCRYHIKYGIIKSSSGTLQIRESSRDTPGNGFFHVMVS